MMIDDNGSDKYVPFYITANKPFPVCNHSPKDVTDDNLGYAQGIFTDGNPFEADIWKDGDTLNLSVYLNEIPEYAPDNDDADDETPELSEDSNFHSNYKWNSVLAIGMVDRDIQADVLESDKYVQYLIDMGIIKYMTIYRNGNLHFLTDSDGNDLVCIDITLQYDENIQAETTLTFRNFPDYFNRTPKLEIIPCGDEKQ